MVLDQSLKNLLFDNLFNDEIIRDVQKGVKLLAFAQPVPRTATDWSEVECIITFMLREEDTNSVYI